MSKRYFCERIEIKNKLWFIGNLEKCFRFTWCIVNYTREKQKLSFIIFIFCTCWFSCMEMHNKRNSFIFNRNAHDAPKMSDFENTKISGACCWCVSKCICMLKHISCEKISGVLMLRSFAYLAAESMKHTINSEACKKYVDV